MADYGSPAVKRPRSHYVRGEARKALLLDAAVEVIAERGLEGVTHRAIAAAAGVPLAATSYFFGSLDELIGAAVTRIADGILESAESLAAKTFALGRMVDSFDEYIDDFVETVVASRDRQILVQFEAYLGTTRRPELVATVARIVEAYETATADVLSKLGAADAENAARHLVAILDGFALQRIARPRPDDHAVLAQAIRVFANTYLRLDQRH